MNLYLFPESASLTNGYGIAVNLDFSLLCPSQSDIIVWYTNNENNPKLKEDDVILHRPIMFSLKRFKNMLLNKVSSEVNASELYFLKEKTFEKIHCDDVIFYRAIRKLFPKQKITVRFHNCFSRILVRKRLLGITLDYKFEINLRSMYQLEREIFMDENVYKIFISEEDKDYYTLMTGSNDASVWGIDIDIDKMKINRKRCFFDNKLIWVGGVEAHKKKSVDWFIASVFPKIKDEIPSVEFHLWGNKTKQFNSPNSNIYGHGFYEGKDLPMKNSGLFVNPDVIGGGVKIKLKTYFEEGVSFISSPFGFEGYDKELIDGQYCVIAELDKWAESIIDLLKRK